jgi:hypothetical protein
MRIARWLLEPREIVVRDANSAALESAQHSGSAVHRRSILVAALALCAGSLTAAVTTTCGGVYADIDGDTVVLGNWYVHRTWNTAAFETTEIVDARTGLRLGASADFSLERVDGTSISSRDMTAIDVRVTRVERDGLAVTFVLAPALPAVPLPGTSLPAAGTIERTYTLWPGVAGFQVDTALALPGAYTDYTLDAVAVPSAAAAAHHFNAGYDWRGSDEVFDWQPTVAPFAGSHAGQDHRVTTTGTALDVTAQWLSLDTDGDLATTSDPRVFQVLQRVNYDSSHAAYDGEIGRVHVDMADDLVYLGPFEGDLHLDNPLPGPVRARVVLPGERVRLERVFTGLAIDADDEAWQHLVYLSRHSWTGWKVGDVVFNSNGVDRNRISTGAKDDMDFAETVRQAEIAQRIGIETFVLDDGWQAASGDWCPDSADCPEPRKATTGYPDRFPDSEFTAVRSALEQFGGMRLGLWMTPMHFNPASDAYRRNPTWACTPLGDGLVLYNTADPDSSSNEAGLGTWDPRAIGPDGVMIGHIESRIRRAIDVYGARYFKFDFLAWIDCADGADAYRYREEFVAMVDRVRADHRDVTIQIDETNDYRLFPFESVARGPSWYANGSPRPNEALHNLWIHAPYVPGSTLGQGAMARTGEGWSADYLGAVMLGSHVTFFRDLTEYSEAEVAAAARWVALYKKHRSRFAGLAYPLLDDPLPGDNWTALQWWNPASGRGALAVYRQDSPDDTHAVALRGVRGSRTFQLRDAETSEPFGTFSAAQLRAGITIALPQRNSARVLTIDPS